MRAVLCPGLLLAVTLCGVSSGWGARPDLRDRAPGWPDTVLAHVAEYAATGLPPAYLPKDEIER